MASLSSFYCIIWPLPIQSIPNYNLKCHVFSTIHFFSYWFISFVSVDFGHGQAACLLQYIVLHQSLSIATTTAKPTALFRYVINKVKTKLKPMRSNKIYLRMKPIFNSLLLGLAIECAALRANRSIVHTFENRHVFEIERAAATFTQTAEIKKEEKRTDEGRRNTHACIANTKAISIRWSVVIAATSLHPIFSCKMKSSY